MIKSLLNHLNIKIVRPEGDGQYLCTCPTCGGDKLYINRQTGLWDCKRNCGNGNPYELVKLCTRKEGKEVFDILEQCGLSTDRQAAAPVQQQPKKLAITAADVRQIMDAELDQICEVKKLDRESLLKFQPLASKHEPEMLLPAFWPGDMAKASAILRCRFDGQKIQTKHGEEKYPMVFGSRHGLFGLKWLTQVNPEEIIFAEGWRDALAAIKAGFYATASSGGASCFKDEWLPFFEGKVVYIIMDEDAAGVGGWVTNKETGNKTHNKGAAIRAANKIWTVAKEVRIVRLPFEWQESHGQDLYNYFEQNDAQHFLLLLKTAPVFVPDANVSQPEQESNTPAVTEQGVDNRVVVLKDDHPDTIAEAFEQWSNDVCKVKHRYNSIDGWSLYNNNRYQKIEDDKELEVYLRQFLQLCKFQAKIKQDDGTYKKYNASPDKKHKSPAYINSILKWLRDIPNVHLRPSQKAPCSLDGTLNPINILATKSCLLDIETTTTKPLTSQFYTFNYLPYNYDANATSEKWINFLVDITDSDKDVMILLQQWCGYLLMPTNKYQKFLLCVGDGANGKFVFFDTVAAALGKNNVSNVPLACFSEPYKIFSTFGKAVNMSNENAKQLEANAESVIKEYVGGDKMLWEQKYKDAFSAYPTAKLMFATNILPVIRDTSDGIWRRMLYVPFDVQIPISKQNKNLDKELQAETELAGILNWMLDGRKLLIENDGFITPKRCQEELNKYRDESNSARLFITEHLEVATDENAYLVKSELYAGYQKWCRDNGYHAKGNSHFGQDVKKYFAMSKDARLHIEGTKKTVYTGIQLQDGVVLGQGNLINTGYGQGGSLYEKSGKYDEE